MKKSKSCTSCDKEVFESKTVFEPPHPYAGQIRQAGPPLPDAMRLTFALSNGSRCDLTFCKECADNLTPEQFPALWRKCLEAYAYEIRHYDRLSPAQQPRTPEQLAAVTKDMEDMAGMCLLGVLASESWIGVRAREQAEKVILGR